MSINFCGLTVTGFQCQGALAAGSGRLRVQLAEDPTAGDEPDFPAVGQPVYFTDGDNFEFNGILASVEQVLDGGGLQWAADVADPAEVLDAAAVVLDGYAGASPLVNVLSPFGYWEAAGFGASRAAGGTMPWSLVKTALLDICNDPISTWGGPVTYRGVAYAVDLTAVPSMPAAYRVAGGQSLLGIIAQVCRDAGCEFWLSLTGLTITVNVVDRKAAVTPGALTALITSYAGSVARSRVGTENVPDCNTTFVLAGGPLSTVYVSQALLSYWGDDLSGNPVAGRPFTHPGAELEPCEEMTIPVPGCEDAAQGLLYRTNTIELRCAMEGFDSWAAYIARHKPVDLPAGVLDAAYSFTVGVEGVGGPYVWATTGTLPPGLSFAGGTLSGTPTAAGTYDFWVKATPSGQPPVEEHYRVRVGVAGLTVTPATLPGATERVYYSATPGLTGGATSPVWTVASGHLPAGLSMDPATGKITGVPLAAGPHSFVVAVTDAATGQTGLTQMSLAVTAAPGKPSVAPPTVADPVEGVPYSATFTASGGTSPYGYAVGVYGPAPPGLRMNQATGELSGTPTASGKFTFVVEATDAAGNTGARGYSVEVAPKVVTPFLTPRGQATWLATLLNPTAATETRTDALKDSPTAVRAAFAVDANSAAYRLWVLLAGLAEAFYGKAFLAAVPDVLVRLPTEFDEGPTYSLEPAPAGYLPAGAAAVGLGDLDRAAFEDEAGRVKPFVVVPTDTPSDYPKADSFLSVDGGRLPADASAKVGPKWYLVADVDPRPRAVGGSCYARVTAAAAAFLQEPLSGGELDKNLFFGGNAAAQEKARHNGVQGTLGALTTHPRAVYPTAIGVPLVSNVAVYGPWASAGGSGRVVYEQDETLVPWAYGGAAALDTVAQARVDNAASSQTLVEAGEFTLPGPPLANPGLTLAGGPVLTAVDAQYSVQGVTTTYRFSSSTPRQFREGYGRQQTDRVQVATKKALEARRAAARTAGKRQAVAAGLTRARAARQLGRGDLPGYATHRSPHEAVVAGAWRAADGSVRVGAATAEALEALALSRPGATGDNAPFRNTVVSHLSAVIRGYSAEKPAWTGSLLPAYKWVAPTELGGGNSPLTSEMLFPRPTGADTDWRTWGPTYAGAKPRDGSPSPTGLRDLALAGPMVVEGWGYGTDGRTYPTGETPTSFAPNHLRRSDLWPVGAVDMLWDPYRGVWTSHDVLTGTAPSGIPAAATGLMRVGGSADWPIVVYNRGAAAVPPSGELMAAYVTNKNRWETLTGGGDGETGGGTLVRITGDRDGTTGYYPGQVVTHHNPATDTYTYGEAVWFAAANDGDVGMTDGSGYFHGSHYGETTGEGEDERPVYIGDSWGEAEVEEVDPGGTPTLDGSGAVECDPETGLISSIDLTGVTVDLPTVTRVFRGVGLVYVPPPPPPPP